MAEAQQAVVTGGARGIGRAIAERLAGDGWSVCATDADADAIEQAEIEWQSAGLAIVGARLDVRDRPGACALFDRLGPVGLLVNNAGIGSPLTGFLDLKRDDIERVLSVNVHGSFIMAQEAARRMSGGGAIVNIASRGYLGGAGAAHYVASKAAVVGLTRAMAIELRWQQIRVNAIAPGMIETRQMGLFEPAMLSALLRLEPTGEGHQPAMIADTVAFLASDAARGMTGQVLLADGGKSLGVAPF